MGEKSAMVPWSTLDLWDGHFLHCPRALGIDVPGRFQKRGVEYQNSKKPGAIGNCHAETTLMTISYHLDSQIHSQCLYQE